MRLIYEFYERSTGPITLVARKVEFCCEICKLPGKGPANMRVHQGKCRTALIKKNAKLAAGRRKQRKLAARERIQQVPAVQHEERLEVAC